MRGVFLYWAELQRRAAVAGFLLTPQLLAQAPPSPTPPVAESPVAPTTPIIVAPVLLEDRTATYPDGASRPDSAAPSEVVLALLIDPSGAVQTASVVQSGGAELDEAALAVTPFLRFAPARKDGQTVPARILYRPSFAPPPSAEPSAVEHPAAERPAPSAARPRLGTAPLTSAADAAAAALADQARRASTEPTAAEDLEVSVVGERSLKERLEKSSDAVTVVRFDEQRKRSADMGEVLARVPGVVIRRSGGLGSDVRFSLNGLTGDAIPMFVDGVPLWMSGYPRNIGNIPINSVQHVEIYRGVVPLRLSADALGGAVNFATDRSYEDGASASYHVGSYGLVRLYGSAQARHDTSGLVARLSGFVDRARNDYPIDVEVPDEQGRLHPATVRRFHDGYSAYALRGEVGFVEKPWAKRLLLKTFAAGSNKEVPHNTVMTVPYGEVNYGLTNVGALLNYDVDFSKAVTLESLVSYSHMATDFRDMSPWVYDWYGNQVRERRVPGEIEADPTDQTWWENGIFSRVLAEWKLNREQVLIASTSPLFYWVTGDERLQFDPEARDPLSARRFLVRWVSGIGHEWNFLRTQQARKNGTYRRNTDYRFQNTFNIKNYAYHTTSEEPLPGGIFRDRQREVVSFGVSDGIRYSFTEWLLAKASYEYATRLPNPFETFGDGLLVQSNLELEPEVSHNVNVGPVLDWKKTKTGDWIGTISGVLRETDNMIVLMGSDRFFSYQNVYRARTLGLEGGLTWTSPLKLLSLDGSGTYTDQRNTSQEGTFADFEGDRIPNRPWLQASWAARLRFESLLVQKDTLEPFYQGRYTHEFYRGWESQGIPQYKQKVDSQTAHDAGITYTLRRSKFRLASTLEVQNLTDAKLYDDFGVQRPGRSFHFKMTGDLL